MSQKATSGFVPDYSVHPGALLRLVLEQRGIRQSELAERTGLSTKHINQLVKENIGISGDVAVLLERALGVDAEFWINADIRHSLHSSRERAEKQLLSYRSWVHSFDTKTLVREGIIQSTDASSTQAEKTLRFFNVASPQAFDDTWMRPRVSFRRSQAFTVAEHNTALWLRLVERSAEDIDVEPFREPALRKVAKSLAKFTTLSIVDGFRAARTALAAAGVVLTFVREVPGTRVCGATWWLAADRPVVAVTERQRKPDIFWWTLLHECGHLALHPRRETFLDLERDKRSADTAEIEADAFASAILLPGDSAQRLQPGTTREELLLLAAQLGVGPGIIAGQYGHKTERWSYVASLRGKISDTDVKMLERCVGRPRVGHARRR